MEVIGLGIDVVDLRQIGPMISRPDGIFIARCFTAAERDAAGEGPHRTGRLAGRFAGKEAVLKAIGTGWIEGISWADIEIRQDPSGAATPVLYGRCAEAARALGVRAWLLSICGCDSYAYASAIALGVRPGRDQEAGE